MDLVRKLLVRQVSRTGNVALVRRLCIVQSEYVEERHIAYIDPSCEISRWHAPAAEQVPNPLVGAVDTVLVWNRLDEGTIDVGRVQAHGVESRLLGFYEFPKRLFGQRLAGEIREQNVEAGKERGGDWLPICLSVRVVALESAAKGVDSGSERAGKDESLQAQRPRGREFVCRKE